MNSLSESYTLFKLSCIMHSVFYGRCPAYLTTTVQSLNASRPHLGQRLRSTSSTDFSVYRSYATYQVWRACFLACQSRCMELIARTHTCCTRHSCFQETAEDAYSELVTDFLCRTDFVTLDRSPDLFAHRFYVLVLFFLF